MVPRTRGVMKPDPRCSFPASFALVSAQPGTAFSHVCVCVSATEIGRVRKDMYNDSVNGGMFNGRDLEELPEAVGPVVQLQEKLYVPVKEYPDVSGPTGDLSPSEGFLFTFSCCLLFVQEGSAQSEPSSLSLHVSRSELTKQIDNDSVCRLHGDKYLEYV